MVIKAWYMNKDENFIVLVSMPKKAGSYLVDFNSREVKFITCNQAKKMVKRTENGPDVLTRCSFSTSNMRKKDGCEGTVMSCVVTNMTWFKNGKELNLIVEYIDSTKGKILAHNHLGKVREVYLSAEKPYGDGEVCGYNENHEPFCNHTIAVKVIEK